MSVPINPTDYKRFLALAELLSEGEGEISIYIGDSGYVSLEMKTKSADVNEIRSILGAPTMSTSRILGRDPVETRSGDAS